MAFSDAEMTRKAVEPCPRWLSKPDSLLRARLFHGAVDFPSGFPFFDGLPPVVGFLPARKGEFQLHPSSLIEIQAERDEGEAFLLDFGLQPFNLFLMQEQGSGFPISG